MGRPKKTKGSPIVYSRGINLTEEQENRLLDLLGIDFDDPDEGVDIGIILSDIKILLGTYDGLADATDKAPRPANYIHEIGDPPNDISVKTGLVYAANDLLQTLCKTSYWIGESYKAVGYDTHKIERELGKFIDASSKVVEKLKKSEIESRGKPEKKALKIIINHMNSLFEKYYAVPDLDDNTLEDKDQSDGRKMSGRDISKKNFIEECLNFAGIKYPPNWLHLLYSESDLPEDRILLRPF